MSYRSRPKHHSMWMRPGVSCAIQSTKAQSMCTIGTTKRKHREWFDENHAEAATILRKMHESHLQWINDRESAAKADTSYRHHKQPAQARLRAMKEQWWSDRATELQEAADRKNAKLFYDGLKGIRSTSNICVWR